MTPLARCSLACALLGFSPPALAGVIVVDPSGAGSFTEINPAVVAAVEGDLVLVKSGTYAGFMVDDKAVAVVADAGAVVNVLGTVHIGALAAGKTVVLDRLNVMTPYTGVSVNSYGLRAVNCAGRIRVQGCTLSGAHGNPDGLGPGCVAVGSTSGWEGAYLDHCSDVAFSLCVLRGGSASDLYEFPQCDGQPVYGDHGGNGLKSWFSTVSLYDCQSFGGAGSDAWFGGGAAGSGIEAGMSNIDASNVLMAGGKGGDAWDYFGPTDPAPGGAGILAGAGSFVRVLDCSMQPGASGSSLWGSPPPYLPADGGAAYKLLSGASKGFGIPRVLRELQNTFMTFTGVGGDAAFLFLSPATAKIPAPSLKGVLHLSGSALLGPVAVGVVPLAGTLQVPISVPPLPAGILGAEVYLQGVLAATAGGTLTSWVHVTLLDSSL